MLRGKGLTVVEFQRFVIAFVLSAVRLGTAMAILPATSNAMITGLARRAAVLAFASLLVPCVRSWMPPGEIQTGVVCLVALKEAVVGLLIGFFASIPFWVVEGVGGLVDNQCGLTMGEVYSPLSAAPVSTTSLFLSQLVSTVFFAGGAFLVFLGAVYGSYSVVPMFGGWPAFAPGAPAFALETADGAMETTLVIAAPLVLLMFLATVGFGLMNRSAPQLNVFFLSMPVKSALCIATLAVYLQYVLDMLAYGEEGAILGPVMKLLKG